MTQIRIEGFTGATPIDVYISDFYGNNKYYLGQITGSTPPTIYQYPPTLFNDAPQIMLSMSASNGCELSKLINCSPGCGFTFNIQQESCDTEIIITDI